MLTVKPTENRSLRENRFENNIEMKLQEIGISTRNWIDSDQDRDYWRELVNVAFNLWVP